MQVDKTRNSLIFETIVAILEHGPETRSFFTRNQDGIPQISSGRRFFDLEFCQVFYACIQLFPTSWEVGLATPPQSLETGTPPVEPDHNAPAERLSDE
jgi:hypothetical protein